MLKYTIRKRLDVIFLIIAIATGLYWTSLKTGISFSNFIKGVPNAGEFLISMLPPNFAVLPKLVPRILETIKMALAAIILATLIALPLSFLAAKNTSPSVIVYRSMRLILNFLRSIPTLLFALIFIAMVGLGPFPGVLGLMFHCIGTLGKYFSESIENVNPRVIEAIKATGANKIQVIMFGIILELKPMLFSYTFYYFEYCIRAASMLGIVGAGGIGMELLFHMRLFRYREAFAVLLVIVGMVSLVDFTSFIIRKRMIGLKKT